MPSEKHPKAKSVESLRHAEYYGMQRTFDELYARSQAGEVFDNLMELILSKDNIMLAYRNIKSNPGSATPGTDRLRITDIGRLPADEVVARVRKIVRGGTNGYTPRSIKGWRSLSGRNWTTTSGNAMRSFRIRWVVGHICSKVDCRPVAPMALARRALIIRFQRKP